MVKIQGIKSVDFRIIAYGHGVVNWNGATPLMMENGKTAKNHILPKLRGYSNLSGKIKLETGHKYYKKAYDIDFEETPLYISQNCIRHHLFRDHAYDSHYIKGNNLIETLASITGLIRGYAVPESQCHRASPLFLGDFVDQLNNGNFEQMGRSGPKERKIDAEGNEIASNTFFSRTTFGDTEYIAHGSINIEKIQFISLDKKFDRASMIIKEGEGEIIAERIQDFIKSLDPSKEPQAIFHNNYVRQGTIYHEGEAGILLDNTAIDILVKETLNMLEDLVIQQAQGYMYVETLDVDYNDSNKMMRIKRNPYLFNAEPRTDYAVYFKAE
ncbi:hypothetical protein J7560_06670 [Wohlfahrtiimonas chitiniclastica]|uniref:type I-Fv CRISPR-associated protein Cas7fv n=1 Tax=Wohlfahrtiimonas chitiniclastica TaxID=400946 RepID=UPI001BD19C52|nr:type I-Fv CRISPR-associated protein Cas7fv [Wohlfahrtiimonas chitiniclastica]MBS7815097.1 hypothetical protein [Wohlfahrtiimonas chitiniclastica]